VQTTVLTISTSVARGDGEDVSGPLLAELAEAAGADVVSAEVLPDDALTIEERLRHHVGRGVAFIFTTGGTGFTPDDVTPEATRAVIDREAPGYAETMRAQSLAHTPLGILTRGVSGIAGQTLIVNFPGNPKAIAEAGEGIREALPHAVGLLHP
jgi:molybdenum cofactor synthesis domain-containing protein